MPVQTKTAAHTPHSRLQGHRAMPAQTMRAVHGPQSRLQRHSVAPAQSRTIGHSQAMQCWGRGGPCGGSRLRER